LAGGKMETSEHYLEFNPYDGHPDKVTNAEGYNYFFIGNGYIELAIQYNKSCKGSPYAIILMDPTKFGRKSKSFTYDEKTGFERTLLEIHINGKKYLPNSESLNVYWDFEKSIPTVRMEWKADNIQVVEELCCPDYSNPVIIRNICLKNISQKKMQGELFIDMDISEKIYQNKRKFQFTIASENEKKFQFAYSINQGMKGNVLVELIEKQMPINSYEKYWQCINKVHFGNEMFNFIYNTSKNQIGATLAHNGMMDASIWQYNLEWVRDLSNISIGMTMSGQYDKAKKIISRLISDFVDEDGSTIDSSRKRPLSEVELDQNGILLYAIWTYKNWTDDSSIIKDNWEKIKLIADFPIQEVFIDKSSGLLKNCREYWERHNTFGVTKGFELTYQLFPIIGLEKASEFALEMGEKDLSKKWKSAADNLKKAFLTNPKYALISDGHFIKRRKESGIQHRSFEPPDKTLLPEEMPLREEIENLVDPDSSVALPIAYELIDPKSKLAKDTLEHLEKLWNQRWNTGGYARYNVKSEPDTPGPWPFATMFIARAYLENENQPKVLRALQWMYDKARVSGSWFESYCWRPSPPLPPISIIPWTWAENIVFFIHHLIGLRPLKDKIIIRPKLLDLTSKIDAKFTVKNTTFKLIIQKKKDLDASYAVVNKVEKVLFKGDGIVIPFNNHIKEINIYLK
jgi:hypothetical protein